MEALKIFEYQQRKVRTTITEEGETLWAVEDVCRVLGIAHYRDAFASLDDDQKVVMILQGKNCASVAETDGREEITKVSKSVKKCASVGIGDGRETNSKQSRRKLINMINESGVYELIFRSNKSEAKAFRKWVTSEVLPTLRKTGRYDMPQDISERLQAMAEQIRVKDMLLQEADREKVRLREQVQSRQDMVETLSRYAEKNTEKNMLPAGRRRQEMASATTRVPIKKVKYIQKLANQGRELEDISEIVGMKYERVCQVLASLEA